MKNLDDYQSLLMKMILIRIPGIYSSSLIKKNVTLNFSIKSRRQPILAYSTRRKNFSGVNINQSVLNINETPINNKRKLGGCTPTNKLFKLQLNKINDSIFNNFDIFKNLILVMI
jgi:hypothetical protein